MFVDEDLELEPGRVTMQHHTLTRPGQRELENELERELSALVRVLRNLKRIVGRRHVPAAASILALFYGATL